STKTILEEQKKGLETELKEIIDNPKGEQDAVQIESTTEISEQSETGSSQEVQQGYEQEAIQVPTEQSQEIIQEEVIPDNSERIAEIQTTLERNEGELANTELDPEMREFIGIQ